jgi:transcription elongation factor GreA
MDITMEKVPIRRDGLERLQDELKQLKTVERPAIIRAIAEAREHGDLSENAEYHAARERQSFIEGRVAELEDVISRAEVIDSSKIDGGTVTFGTTIKVADEDTDEESTYTIVGPYEADISQGLISTSSPIARALIGKRVGDSAEVTTPRGTKGYEVLSISVS